MILKVRVVLIGLSLQRTVQSAMEDKFTIERTNAKSDFLFTNGSLKHGIATLLNLRGRYFEYNTSKSGMAADDKAFTKDWQVVANDLSDAINEFKVD